MTDNKSLDAIIATELPDTKCEWCGRTIAAIEFCNCKDVIVKPIVEKISFHFGISVRDIEKVLKAKD